MALGIRTGTQAPVDLVEIGLADDPHVHAQGSEALHETPRLRNVLVPGRDTDPVPVEAEHREIAIQRLGAVIRLRHALPSCPFATLLAPLHANARGGSDSPARAVTPVRVQAIPSHW